MMRTFLYFWILLCCFTGNFFAQNTSKLPLLESAVDTFQKNTPYSQKVATAQKLAKYEDYFAGISERLSHPSPQVRLWFLKTLTEFNQETWRKLPLASENRKIPAVEVKSESSAVIYTFPSTSTPQPLKISFVTSLTNLGGTLQIGSDEFIFGFNATSYHFYRKGETPKSISWNPCFLEERILQGNMREKYIQQLNQLELPQEIWTVLNQRMTKDEIPFSEQSKLTLEKVRDGKEWNLLDTTNLQKYIIQLETEASRPYLNIYPNEKVHVQIVCYPDFLCFYLFYGKDIYPRYLSRKDKTIMRSYEETYLSYTVPIATPVKVTLPNSIWNENIEVFSDPFLYKIVPLLRDENPEIRYQVLDLLVRGAQEGGRDYVRRLLECKIPAIQNFLNRENLVEAITQLYRKKILNAFNQERRAGAGHYEGQFRDVTLMGRQIVGDCLIELATKHNNDLENSMIRKLSLQALQELQYAPTWLKNKLEEHRQSVEELVEVSTPPKPWNQDEIRMRIWKEELRDLTAVIAAALYMLGDDSYFKQAEQQLLYQLRLGSDPFGRPLLYVEMELAYLYLRFRMYEKALDIYAKTIRNPAYPKNQLGIVYYNMACAYAMKRMKKEAVEAFRISVEECEYSHLEWLLKDRDLDYIRNEPEFIRLVKKLEDFNNR